jgi:hypothetical protein
MPIFNIIAGSKFRKDEMGFLVAKVGIFEQVIE